LAGALVVVGCQNYDDQFNNLESQINALASTVAGLSQVQTDLASLSGTVASLASTVNGLGSQIDTAVANGLSDIQADIDAIEAAVADVASGEAVDALAEAVADSQADLDELLANSSVFNNSIVINSQATAELYEAMGSSINIVNGDVTITVSEDMDQTTVQAVVDNILNIIGDLTYTAGASTIAETTFNNLAGVESITAKQGGGYEFKSLASATNIVLNNDYKSTVDIIHLGALTNVTTISDDGGTAGTISFDKAEEFHLTSLVRYPGNNLNITIKEGGVLAIPALDDVQADGTDVGAGYALTVSGPASLSLTNITDGTITAANVATLSISNFRGAVDINDGVETLTLDGAVGNSSGAVDIAGATDLVTVSIAGALDSDPNLSTADTAGPSVTFTSAHADLTTVTLSGVLGAISATSAANLETLTVTADLNGAALSVTGNNDLVNLNVAGAKLANVTVGSNTDLETLTLDHTTELASGDTGATVSITGNTNMETLTFSADDVDSLTVTGNTQLGTINFTGLADLGTSTTATVAISDNKLVAQTSKDAYDTAPTTSDTGAYTTNSGMATLKTYLTAAMAATGAKNIAVYFDTIELAQSQASATASYADDTHTDAITGTGVNAVAYAVTTAASGTTIRETISTVFPAIKNELDAGVQTLNTNEGVTVTAGGLSTTYKQSSSIATIAELVTAINAATDYGSSFTITAAQDSYKQSVQQINYFGSDGSTSGSASGTGSLYFVFGTITGTITVANGDGANAFASALATQISGTSRSPGAISTNLYNADADTVSGEILITSTVSVAGYPSDLSSAAGSIPTLSFVIDAAQTSTTVSLKSGVSSNSAGLNSDYFLGVRAQSLTGLRVTVKNNSTSVAGGMSVNHSGGGTAIGTASAALASGTNMIGNTALVAGFTEIETQVPASTSTKNRISWLG
jgi:hypothetical protein